MSDILFPWNCTCLGFRSSVSKTITEPVQQRNIHCNATKPAYRDTNLITLSVVGPIAASSLAYTHACQLAFLLVDLTEPRTSLCVGSNVSFQLGWTLPAKVSGCIFINHYCIGLPPLEEDLELS